MNNATPSMFEDVVVFPDDGAGDRYRRLVGLDETKEHVAREATLLLAPQKLQEWSQKHHGKPIALLERFQQRTSMFLFSGDVGTGKTELAETFGHAVARAGKMTVTAYRISLFARGRGAVGEMTSLVTRAFAEVTEAAKRYVGGAKVPRGAVILVIDEADALAQSRGLAQMHHEDRAGVNALIRGLDGLTAHRLPALVVLCTNRLDSIDPAVRRRAAKVFHFERPGAAECAEVLSCLGDAGFTTKQIEELAAELGDTRRNGFGCTYSDLVQRFLPSLVLDAFPNRPVTPARALELAQEFSPTPPFREDGANHTHPSPGG